MPQMPGVMRHKTVGPQKVPKTSEIKSGKSFFDIETFFYQTLETQKILFFSIFCLLIFVPMIVCES